VLNTTSTQVERANRRHNNFEAIRTLNFERLRSRLLSSIVIQNDFRKLALRIGQVLRRCAKVREGARHSRILKQGGSTLDPICKTNSKCLRLPRFVGQVLGGKLGAQEP